MRASAAASAAPHKASQVDPVEEIATVARRLVEKGRPVLACGGTAILGDLPVGPTASVFALGAGGVVCAVHLSEEGAAGHDEEKWRDVHDHLGAALIEKEGNGEVTLVG